MFFRFAPMGKVEKTRFERNWTTFVNPAFSAAWKSPPKMVAWNRNCKIRSQGCFFVSPRWGKLKKRVLNGIGRPSNPAFSAAWKSPPKMVAWNRNCKIRSQGCFFVSPRWGKLRFEKPSSIRLFPLLGKAHPKWWWNRNCRPMGKVEKTRFERNFDLRPHGFFRCLEKPTQNGGMKPKL